MNLFVMAEHSPITLIIYTPFLYVDVSINDSSPDVTSLIFLEYIALPVMSYILISALAISFVNSSFMLFADLLCVIITLLFVIGSTPSMPLRVKHSFIPSHASIFPYPQMLSEFDVSPVNSSLLEVLMIISLISSGDNVGRASNHVAIIPVTTGAAIDVPLIIP